MTVTINGTSGVDGPALLLNGPSFSVGSSVETSCLNNTATKITFDVENYDTTGRFNPTNATVNGIPAYSFMPTVAGYYLFLIDIQYVGTTHTSVVAIFTSKNASNAEICALPGTQWVHGTVCNLIYFNGTTDYIYISAKQVQGTTQNFRGTNFTGMLIKAA